jgi:DNA-binding beta-propeller fold protein YncE
LISRRHLLASPLALAACKKEKANGFDGYAFVANQEGQAIAAVDLTAFAVAKHIRIDGQPKSVLAHPTRDAVYALGTGNGAIYEIDPAQLAFRRKVTVSSDLLDLQLTDTGELWALSRSPRRLLLLDPETLRPIRQVPLPAEPVSLHLAQREHWALVLYNDHPPTLIQRDEGRHVAKFELPHPPSLAAFQGNGRAVLFAAREAQMLSLYELPSLRLITHLPLALKPDRFCFKGDGGQLFITGEGLDAVVVVYPYRGEVAETVLAGRAPGAMTVASTPDADFLFVASPSRNDVSILDIVTHKTVAVVSVGQDPGFLTVTPDNQYVLVLNRASGDMAVLRLKSIVPNRNKTAPLFTMIPVGSRPVQAVVRAV